MAIDTAAKRGSAINISMPWRPFLPLPDGTIDQGDRQAVPYLYNGILASGPVIDTDVHNLPFHVTVGKLKSF